MLKIKIIGIKVLYSLLKKKDKVLTPSWLHLATNNLKVN